MYLVNPTVLNAVNNLFSFMTTSRCAEYGPTAFVNIVHTIWR